MVNVRISQPDYTVNEGEGTVTVCVERQGQTTMSITVTVMTAAGTATGKSVCCLQEPASVHFIALTHNILSITYDSYN